jgi:high-affinity nickel permease
MPADLSIVLAAVTGTTGSLLLTALALGLNHGVDWDHIAAITDITSTTAAADVAEEAHEVEHARQTGHEHGHGDESERRAHPGEVTPVVASGGSGVAAMPLVVARPRRRFVAEQRRAMTLGTLYALGHALVVALLGLAALQLGALLPQWVDPIMGRVVGLTLLVLGVWVFVSLYQYARYGREFRLRSRWMLVFDGFRYAWRWLQARLHGHEHVRPLEMSSYRPRTAFLVGVIHGIGAETGSQVLLIAAVGGAAGLGLGVPMLLAFILGLLISNSAIILVTSLGFVSSQVRTGLYLAAGIVAGVLSVVVGTLFLLGAEGTLPDLEQALRSIG